MPYVQLNDVKLHYQKQGEGKVPIVFIHGNFGSWRHWMPALDSLADNYTCYAPDFRGCGDSSAPVGSYDIETLSYDILSFADALELDQFHLVGHSLGGAVAQELAGTSPERIITLTLLAPAPAEGLKSLEKVSTSGSTFSATNVFQFFDNIGLRKTIHRASFKKTMPVLRNNKAYLDIITEDAVKMDIKAFDGFLKALKTWRGTECLKNLNMPVLIIHGDLDSVVPLQPLKNMQQHIKGCKFHTFHGIGHAPQMENPEAFNKLLTAFLRGNDIEPMSNFFFKKVPTGLLAKLKLKLKHIFK
jgi:branched-chain amino acid transport system permease protein